MAQAIWNGHAIMGTDGSVKEGKATYSWVISTSMTEIRMDDCCGGYLPPPAQYMEHYSKWPEAAAIYAGLTWINDLLQQFSDSNPTSSPTPVLTMLVTTHQSSPTYTAL
jgi:hypothetical protein